MAKAGHVWGSSENKSRIHRTKRKSPAFLPGFRMILSPKASLGRLFLDHGLFVGLGLRTAPRALGQRRLDLLDRLGLGDALHRRYLARQPVERRLVELAFRVGLLRLRIRPEQVAHDLGDG